MTDQEKISTEIESQKRRNREFLKNLTNPDPKKYRWGCCDFTVDGCIENADGRFLFIDVINNTRIE